MEQEWFEKLEEELEEQIRVILQGKEDESGPLGFAPLAFDEGLKLADRFYQKAYGLNQDE